MEDAVKQEGIRIGVKYGLASKWTGFVAVDEQKPNEKVDKNEKAKVELQELYEGECLDSLESNVCYALSSRPPPPMPSPSKIRRMAAAPTSVAIASVCSDQSTPGGVFFGGSRDEMRKQSPAFGMSARLSGQSDSRVKAKAAGFGGFGFFSKKQESRTSLRPQASSGVFFQRARVSEGQSDEVAEEAATDLPSAPNTQPLTDEEKLHNIIMQQSSSGMFPPNVTLARQLGFDNINTVKDKLPAALKGVSIEVWITILVCVFLETEIGK